MRDVVLLAPRGINRGYFRFDFGGHVGDLSGRVLQ